MVTRPVAAGPAVPADRLDLLRRAFDKTVADEQFKQQMLQLIGDDVDP